MPEGGWDLRHPRPWIPEPMDPAYPDRAWQVRCPSKTGRQGDWDTVVTRVSEGDAKAIAEGGNKP